MKCIPSSIHFRGMMKDTILLLPLFGTTWIFGLLAFHRNLSVFAWLFIIFNTSQVCAIVLMTHHNNHDYTGCFYVILVCTKTRKGQVQCSLSGITIFGTLCTQVRQQMRKLFYPKLKKPSPTTVRFKIIVFKSFN